MNQPHVSICFDVEHLYYLTQYLPVSVELSKRNIPHRFVFHLDNTEFAAINDFIQKNQLDAVNVANRDIALDYYSQLKPHWIVFGNGCLFLEQLPSSIKTAQLYHGIGMKSDVYKADIMQMDVRFIEGNYYKDEVQRLYPGKKLHSVGYPKIDPLIDSSILPSSVNLTELGLKDDRPSILYAPTFYPSSLELMPDDFPKDFANFNIIIKAHQFTYTKSRYAKQRQKLKRWEKFSNVYLVPASVSSPLDYLRLADLLISEASSMLFEFCTQDRPAIWCDFLKLRWTYKGPFRYRIKQRMDQRIGRFNDICPHASSYKDLLTLAKEELAQPQTYSQKRKDYCNQLMGPVDGKASIRVVDYLLASK